MKLLETIKQTASMGGLKVKKYSPEILIGVGLLSFAGTVIVACRQTAIHAEEVLDKHRNQMKNIEDAKEIAVKNPDEYEYDHDLYLKDITITYIRTFGSFAKVYSPALGLGVLSIGCFLTSSNILKNRYLGAVAAYNALSLTFNEYRQRVILEEGEEKDRHYRYGTEIQTLEVLDEKGKKKGTEKIENVDSETISSSAVFFDSSNDNWNENPNISMMFLRGQENYMNDLLRARGHVFLNEVLEALGFEHTQIGAVVGWVYKKDGSAHQIDFGLYRSGEESVRRFVNGLENTILLDFNTDGIIWDKI